MSEQPTSGQAAETTRGIYTGDQPNPILHFVQRPRIMLLLLAGWSILSFLAQTFTNSGLFLEDHKPGKLDMDGALGGLAFGWEGLPLAVVYIYCFRDPQRHRAVFWLGLIHMGAISVSQIYHWGYGNFTFESIAVPFFGSVALGALVFLHIFSPRSHEEVVARAG